MKLIKTRWHGLSMLKKSKNLNSKLKKYRHCYIILLFVFSITFSFAQNDLRKIHGSFIEGRKAFNYEFVQNPGVGYSFELMPIDSDNPLEIFKSNLENIKNLDATKRFSGIGTQGASVIKKTDSVSKAISSFELLLIDKDPKKKTLGTYVDSLSKVSKSLNNLLDNLNFFYKTVSTKGVISPKIDSILIDTTVIKLSQFKAFKAELEILKGKEIELEFQSYLQKDNFKKAYDSFKSEVEKGIGIATQYININNDISESLKRLKFLFEKGTLNRPSSFSEFLPEVFGGVLEDQLKLHDTELVKKLSVSKESGDKNEIDLKELQTRLFYIIKTRLEFEDTQPIAATVMLKNKSISIYNSVNSKKVVKTLDVKNVTLEFEDGVIKNIEALFFPKNNENGSLAVPIRFRNVKPFGITGKFHPDLLRDHNLFNHSKKDSIFNLKLSDLVAYFPNLSVNTENYAPENSVVTLDVASGKTFVQLRKEKTADLLDLKVYSDLAGIRLGNPQGLIQAEFSRRIDLFSKHKQYTKKKFENHNSSWLRYVKPEFIISKIDQKDQFLTYKLESTKTQNEIKLKVTDLYQYQFVRFGADLNIFKYSIPNAQLNVQGVVNSSWYGTNIIESDSLDKYKEVKDVNLNGKRIFSNTSRLGLIVETKPESRWGAKLRWDFIGYNKILSNEFKLDTISINGNKAFRLTNLKTFAFEGFAKTSPNSKFFFRWAYNFSGDHSFYNQLQIGFQSTLQRYIEENRK